MDDILKKHYDIDKIYRVYIEKSYGSYEGYRFMQPQYSSKLFEKKNFILTYHFKQLKSKNPICIIDNIEGDDFDDKIELINHFKQHHALTYSLEVDGFFNFIKEGNKNDRLI